MKHYIEISLLPGQEIPLYFLWSKVYMQLHLAFVEQKDSNEQVAFGVSFPDYVDETSEIGKKPGSLGAKARVFANTPEQLSTLNLKKWFGRLEDYVHMTGIRPVEKATHYLVVNRKRGGPSPLSWAKRHANRHGIPVATAIEKWGETDTKVAERTEKNHLPYVEMRSLSGDHSFRLSIQQVKANQIVEGKFSTYGLSGSTTVPDW